MNLIMMRFRILPLVVSIATVSILQLEPVEAQSKNPAVTPQARVEEWWFARHTENIGQMSKGDIDLLMVGDSITQNFESIGIKPNRALGDAHFAEIRQHAAARHGAQIAH